MRRLKLIMASLMVMFGLLSGTFLLNAGMVVAAPSDEVCRGIGGCEAQNGETGIDSLLATVVNILSIILGVAAVIMIIIGGLKYVTSGGDASKAASAKNTILYAIIGLVVAALAQSLVYFVLKRTTQ